MDDLTIIICTRNRPQELLRCITSIINATRLTQLVFFEIMIIDDDELSINIIEQVRTLINQKGYSLKYLKKEDKHGIFYSRYIAIQNSKTEIILFLDDDVEIEYDYLVYLEKTYSTNPQIIGVGGINILLKEISQQFRLYLLFFCLCSKNPGRISPGGFTFSYLSWLNQKNIFETEMLSGCNMSFKRRSFRNFILVNWFEGYGPGEDDYFSYHARRYGPLIINPKLHVKHHSSSNARDEESKTKSTYLLNRFRFLQLFKAKWWNYLAMFWGIVGLILLNMIIPKYFGSPKGYFLGIVEILKEHLKSKT